MSGFEVQEPILSSPFDEPAEHWHIVQGEESRRVPGRRPAVYHYRPPGPLLESEADGAAGTAIELKRVNLIRRRVKEWRGAGRPGATRTTQELLDYWTREGRQHRLFFAQVEAAETLVCLAEARAAFLQGIAVPPDEPSEDRKAAGYAGFRRLACKMATGTGKTTVMAMLVAWSLLNKVANRSDARFSDVVLVVCPNVPAGLVEQIDGAQHAAIEHHRQVQHRLAAEREDQRVVPEARPDNGLRETPRRDGTRRGGRRQPPSSARIGAGMDTAVVPTFAAFPEAEHRERLARARERLARAGFDGCVSA